MLDINHQQPHFHEKQSEGSSSQYNLFCLDSLFKQCISSVSKSIYILFIFGNTDNSSNEKNYNASLIMFPWEENTDRQRRVFTRRHGRLIPGNGGEWDWHLPRSWSMRTIYAFRFLSKDGLRSCQKLWQLQGSRGTRWLWIFSIL